MILHLAGTSDARELAVKLRQEGYELTASVVTDSAANSLTEAGVPVRIGRMTADEMAAYITEHGVRLVVDAAHPFAEEAHKNAMAASRACNVPYLRFERESINFDHNPLLHFVEDYAAAAEKAAELKGNIMLTTGSKTLQIFTQRLLGLEGINLTARMLPRLDNMEKCAELGLPQKDIIAMQGPFSKDLNTALYRQYKTNVVITKESGQQGSVDEKVDAALELGLHVIVIGRPKLQYGLAFHDFEAIIEQVNAMREEISHGL
ncbi:precorrin-6A reductase [Tumebacillus algifaecis]|uniref:Precorrin-6A reductase n=1 Tax=Tumebacillus algifaecis TaxID=1214604 RepID=A0A223D4F2_9BACL|nr:precorrin-6A reductase [Tumebacillus algifaecis]ASS76478.1 precorrin-6A reductase [Tumebacillus algifaecis]